MSYFEGMKILVSSTSTFVNNKAVDGKLRISSMSYLYDIAEGNIPGHDHWTKYGYNGDVDNAEEDVIVQGGTYVFPATQLTMSVISTSALDAIGSAGVLTVRVTYLDDTYTEKSVLVSMNGTTAVEVAPDVFRVNSFSVNSMGNPLTATNGALAVYNGSVTYGYISVGKTLARQMIYTVPLGRTLFVTSAVFSVANASANHWARVTMKSNYEHASDTLLQRNLFIPNAEVLLVDCSIVREFEIPVVFPATTDIKVTAISDASNANESVEAALRGWTE